MMEKRSKIGIFLFLCCSLLIQWYAGCHKSTAIVSTVHQSLNEKAQNWLNQRELDSALTAYQQLLAQIPHDSSALKAGLLNELTHIYYMKDNIPLFESYLDSTHKIIQANPHIRPEIEIAYWLNRADKQINDIKDDSLKFYADKVNQQLKILPNLPAKLIVRNALNESFYYLTQAKYDKADSIYQHILARYTSVSEQDSSLLGLLSQIYIGRGYLFDVKGISYELEKMYEKAYFTAQKFKKANYFQEKAAIYLANAKRKAGKYETALNYYQEALVFFQSKNRFLEITECYLGMANVLVEKGEHQAAIEYYTKCIQSYQKAPQNTISAYQKGATFNNLSNAYRDDKNYVEAKRYLYKTLSTYDSEADKIIPILNLGVLYCFENQADSAIFYLKKTLDLDKKVRNIASFESAQALHWLGVAYHQKGNKTESLASFEASLALLKELGYEQSAEQGEIYEAMSDVYAQEKDWEKALNYVQKGLMGVSYHFKAENYHTAPDLTGIASPLQMLKLLRKKGKFLYELYQTNRQTETLDLCLKTRTLALDLVDSIRLDYAATASKLSLMGEVNPLYEAAIKTALELNKLTQNQQHLALAFSFSERNKATVLSESLQSLKASQSANIPDSLVNKMNDLKTDIGYFENQLYKSKNPDSLKSIIVELKEKYQQVDEEIEEKYPDFHRVRYDFPKIDIAKIQQKLAKNHQTMLAFFNGDSAVYAFCLTANNLKVNTIVNADTLTAQLTEIRNLIASNKFASATNPQGLYQTFCKTSFSLYQSLIQPFENQLADSSLLILPDGNLSYLPFEVLISKLPTFKKVNYQALTYLIHNHQISYGYSATLWLQPLQTGKFAEKDYVAFAPSFGQRNPKNPKDIRGEFESERGELIALTETKKEVEAIQKEIGGTVFIDTAATKSRFKKEVEHYKIIHLATHALINNEQPMDSRLVFSPANNDATDDGFLYAYELFGMKMNAQMAVLSACNTGNGKLAKGEGVQSIARGFAYSGVPAIVMSLWPAQDASTSKIMVDFYAQLKQGKDKATALRIAKQNFLDNADAKVMAHPFFWAGFVVIGDTQKIDFEGNSYKKFWIFGGISLLLGMIGLWFWRKRK